MAIVDEKNNFFAGKMRFALDQRNLNLWQVKELSIDNNGTILV